MMRYETTFFHFARFGTSVKCQKSSFIIYFETIVQKISQMFSNHTQRWNWMTNSFFWITRTLQEFIIRQRGLPLKKIQVEQKSYPKNYIVF